MSTPVSSCTPRESRSVANVRDEEELAQQMQRMIRMQYEQQRMIQAEQQTSIDTSNPMITASISSSPPTNMPPQQQFMSPPSIPTSPIQQPQQHPHNSSPTADDLDDSMMIGRGTLILRHPEELLLRRNSSSVIGGATNNSSGNYRRSCSSSTTLTGDPPAAVVTTPLGQFQPLPTKRTSYGALDTMILKLENSHDDQEEPPASQNEQQSRDYFTHTSTNTRQQPYTPPPPPPPPTSIASLAYLFLNCLFLRPLAAVIAAESLHRSFVYGGIDGMLTGAGIVSACAGLGLLPPSTTTANAEDPVVLAHVVVALTAAACCADSVCMAVGHVWTTHVHATAHAAERAHARLSLQHTKAQAKSTLVDLLLAKGVLKLDAMSLVDTLEGYPDLFVSAVTGDALVGGATAANAVATTANSTTPSSIDELTHLMVSSASVVDQEEQRLYQASTHHDHGTSSSSWRSFLSYGRLTDLDMDPDHVTVRNVVAESRKESLCMMLGFSLMSVVPSLIYTWVPSLLVATSMHSSILDTDDGAATANSMMIHPNTLVIFLSACVMWCLGVWKSRFMDSNWLLFGIETVMVLLVCVACAYGLGALLNYVFLPDNYVLQVAKPMSKISKQIHYKSHG